MKSRNWILWTLLTFGIIFCFLFIITQTNLLFKTSDFEVKVRFESPEEGDAGIVALKRNPSTPSVLDWATFDDGEQIHIFSSSYVSPKIRIDLPEIILPGVYYLDVEASFTSGIVQTETIRFRVI